MLLKRALLEPTFNSKTKLHTTLTHTPRISPSTPIEEIACAMVENNIYSLPVIYNDNILGFVTADDIIEKLTIQDIGTQPIKTIMCNKPPYMI